jgi:hypothetical protein
MAIACFEASSKFAISNGEVMIGSLSILNTGAGDINVSFNEHDPAERDKAIKMLKDMQIRGYAILIQLADGTYVRAESFDEVQGRYVIQVPDDTTIPEGATEVPRKRGRPRKVSIPIEKAKATGVARSAGG